MLIPALTAPASTPRAASGRDRRRREGPAGGMRRGRRDREPGAGRFRLPQDDPGRRPDRQLAARRHRAVARPRRDHGTRRQRQPRRSAGSRTRSRRARRAAPIERRRAAPVDAFDKLTLPVAFYLHRWEQAAMQAPILRLRMAAPRIAAQMINDRMKTNTNVKQIHQHAPIFPADEQRILKAGAVSPPD